MHSPGPASFGLLLLYTTRPPFQSLLLETGALQEPSRVWPLTERLPTLPAGPQVVTKAGSASGRAVRVHSVSWLELAAKLPGVLPGRYRAAWRLRLQASGAPAVRPCRAGLPACTAVLGSGVRLAGLRCAACAAFPWPQRHPGPRSTWPGWRLEAA